MPLAYCDLIIRISSVKTIPNKNTTQRVVFLFGGPEEIRTPDPYNANVMRSQLRYGPMCSICRKLYYIPSPLVCQGLSAAERL